MRQQSSKKKKNILIIIFRQHIYIYIHIQVIFCRISDADALNINVLNRVCINVYTFKGLTMKLCGKAITPNTWPTVTLLSSQSVFTY